MYDFLKFGALSSSRNVVERERERERERDSSMYKDVLYYALNSGCTDAKSRNQSPLLEASAAAAAHLKAFRRSLNSQKCVPLYKRDLQGRAGGRGSPTRSLQSKERI